jgi:hypothetical protein
MLAVTHHLLAHLASLKVGRTRPCLWYDNYESLGDDINIFDEKVAHQYLAIMESIGVPINLSKSVVARTAAFEFAKVTGLHSVNVSAISWKMFLSQPTMMGRVNILYSLLNKEIIPARLGAWMRSVLAKSMHNQGNLG